MTTPTTDLVPGGGLDPGMALGLSDSVLGQVARVLEVLGLPPLDISLVVVVLVAALVAQINSHLKGEAQEKGARTPEDVPDSKVWQWIWRVMPMALGLLLGGLVGLLPNVPWEGALLLGLVGGVFSVPIWHFGRRFIPGWQLK